MQPRKKRSRGDQKNSLIHDLRVSPLLYFYCPAVAKQTLFLPAKVLKRRLIWGVLLDMMSGSEVRVRPIFSLHTLALRRTS